MVVSPRQTSMYHKCLRLPVDYAEHRAMTERDQLSEVVVYVAVPLAVAVPFVG